MTKQQIVTRAEFARVAGATRAAVTKACAGSLKPAQVGQRIDMAHPVAIKYLERARARVGKKAAPKPRSKPKAPARRKAPAKRAPKAKAKTKPAAAAKAPHVRGSAARRDRRKAESPGAPDVEIPSTIADYADLTLRELVEKFGTDLRFKDWLAALKMIEDIRDKRIRNAEREGQLIPREMVETFIIGPFDTAHINLLTDGSRTIATRLIGMVQAGASDTDCQKFVADTISKNIRAVKRTIERALANA